MAEDPKLTMDIVVKQNTGLDPGYRCWGGNDAWDWMTHGWPATGARSAPAGMTSLTGYFHDYMERNKPFVDTGMFIKSFQTFVHKKAGGWLLVQDQAKLTQTHNYWKGDFTVVRGGPAIVRHSGPPIEDRVQNPRGGDIEHGWPAARGVFPANTVDWAFTCFLARIDVANACVLMAGGVDWWRDAGAAFVAPPGTNNPACSVASWTKLTTEWQWCTSTNATEAMLTSDPPPPLVAGDVEPPIEPPIEPEPEPETGPRVVIEINGQPMKETDVVTFKMTSGPAPAPVDFEQYKRPEQEPEEG